MPLLAALALVALVSAAPAAAQAVPPATSRTEINDTCLACHSDTELALTLPNGETRSLHVEGETFAKSVHGEKLSCADCHPEMTEVPHPERTFTSRRQFSLVYYEQCKRCHFSTFAKTLDSAHQAPLARGDLTAPLCVDCHGAHDIMSPNRPRTRVSRTCAKCHQGVSATYLKSVHGRALEAEGNLDVPVCTDCHRSHDVAGPHAADWRAHTPELCASCHADEQVMGKYGLSTAVHRTYLSDFHGMTASVRRTDQAASAPVVARCTDCHGIHDITKVDDPESPVLKANLVKTCRQCHADASENFPGAWLSHYEPSWTKTPLVKGVMVAYQVFIPFMIGGLALQILLHLWRVVVNR
jgi:predicted CXXCH cytochrome family protein